MKMPHLKLYVLSAFLLTALSVQAWTLEVQGLVTKDGEKLSGATATLYSSAEKVNRQITSKSGKFRFELEADKSYMVTVTKPGHVTKRVSFYTRNVPADRGHAGFAPFRFEVTLFKDLGDEAITKILSKPMARIHFVKEEDDFGYDEIYTKSIKDKLALVKKAEKRAKFDHIAKKVTEKDLASEKPPITSPVEQSVSPAAPKIQLEKEEFQQGSKKVIIHKGVVNGQEVEYKKVTWGWGATYYFKDGNSITENTYKEATSQ